MRIVKLAVVWAVGLPSRILVQSSRRFMVECTVQCNGPFAFIDGDDMRRQVRRTRALPHRLCMLQLPSRHRIPSMCVPSHILADDLNVTLISLSRIARFLHGERAIRNQAFTCCGMGGLLHHGNSKLHHDGGCHTYVLFTMRWVSIVDTQT